MGKISAYFKLWLDDTALDLFEDLDFTVARTNFQANPRERYLYQSYRSMTPFYNLLSTTIFTSGLLFLTRFRNFIPLVSQQSVRNQMAFSLIMGSGFSMAYSTLYKPREFQNVCNMDDNVYGVIARTLLNTHPDAHLFHEALQIDSKVPSRAFYAVPNFQFSGLPAVVGIPADEDPPVNGVSIPPQVLFDDIINTIKHHREITPRRSERNRLDRSAMKDLETLNLLKGNINAYIDAQGIARPPYFEGLTLPAKRNVPSAPSLENVNYMHIYQDDRETGGQDRPFAFSSATDMMSHYQSQPYNSSLPPDPMQQYKYMEEMRNFTHQLPPQDPNPVASNAISDLLISATSEQQSKH